MSFVRTRPQQRAYGRWFCSHTTERMDTWVVVLITLVALLPLWLFKYPPAADLPHHVAVSSVLYRLFTGDNAVRQYYAVNLQAMPYHLLYVVMTPLVGWLGPFMALKMLLSAVGGACVACTTLCCAALGRPRILGLGGIFLFYNATFFWGFATTLIGIPCVLALIWAMLRLNTTRRLRFAWMAGAFGALACAAHIALAPACGVVVLSFWSMRPRQNMRWAMGVGAACLLPALPWLWSRAGVVDPSASSIVVFESPRTAWNHLRTYLAPFDRGMGRNSHHAWMLVGIVCAIFGYGRGHHAQQRFLIALLAGNVLLFLGVPLEITSPHGSAWLLNVRFLVFAEAALLWLCVEPKKIIGQRLWRLVLVVCVIVHLGALTTVWRAFNRQAQPLDAIAAVLAANSTVLVRSPPEAFDKAWPPLTTHLYAYLLATTHAAYVAGVFSDGHWPIKVIASPKSAAHFAAGGSHPPLPNEAAQPMTLGAYDYAVIQGQPANRRLIAVPYGSQLSRQEGLWALYQPLAAVHGTP